MYISGLSNKSFNYPLIIKGLNNILSSTRFRISIVYFKTLKLFQTNRLRPQKQAGNEVAQPALSVNIYPLTNSSLVNNKNIIEYEINLKMVEIEFFLSFFVVFSY